MTALDNQIFHLLNLLAKTAELIDKEVKMIVDKAYNTALKVLEENREGLEQLANKLLEKEVIFTDDLEQIFGARPKNEPEVTVN